jgi:hypothetical protein
MSDEENADYYDYTQALNQITWEIIDSKSEMEGDSRDAGNGKDVKNIFMARYRNIYWFKKTCLWITAPPCVIYFLLKPLPAIEILGITMRFLHLSGN